MKTYLGGVAVEIESKLEPLTRTLFWLGLGVIQLPTIEWCRRTGFMDGTHAAKGGWIRLPLRFFP
jgi:hypothetical protein